MRGQFVSRRYFASFFLLNNIFGISRKSFVKEYGCDKNNEKYMQILRYIISGIILNYLFKLIR